MKFILIKGIDSYHPDLFRAVYSTLALYRQERSIPVEGFHKGLSYQVEGVRRDFSSVYVYETKTDIVFQFNKRTEEGL